MAAGRRRERRTHAVEQSALVWGLGECDVEAFIQFGTLPSGRPKGLDMSPELRANVERMIDQITANGGRLEIPPPQ
jgi:hypothetical protein